MPFNPISPRPMVPMTPPPQMPKANIPAPKPVARPQDTSIFGGKPEISRSDFAHKLRSDTRVWEAEKQAGLTLSPAERAKLVKDIPEIFGSNISKTDLKSSVDKLNRNLSTAKSPEEHAKLRKEIEFFKKIGGLH